MPKAHRSPRPRASVPPLTDADIGELEALLDLVPAPLEPLDTSMLDGFLCGVLVQPHEVPSARWLAHVTDVDGRPLPPDFDSRRLRTLAERRHAELDLAITGRQWFDPWIFELESDAGHAQHATEAVYPWVAGFTTALGLFPDLTTRAEPKALLEPLALIYRHLDPDDLEDADELLAEIETLEPPSDLAEAVEELVRATLLLADLSRPLAPQGPKAKLRRPSHRS